MSNSKLCSGYTQKKGGFQQMKINQCVLNKSSLYFVLQDPFEAKRNPDHMKDPT